MHVQNGKNRFESTRLEYEREKCNYILLLLLLIQQGSEIRVGVYIVLRTKYNLYLQKFLVISL